MKRNARILQLIINGTQLNNENSQIGEEQTEATHSGHSSKAASPLTVSQLEVRRESPLTHQQEMVVVELENMGFSASDCFKDSGNDLPLYSNKSLLSVFATADDLGLQEPNISSVEYGPQLTPLFTPIPSIQPPASITETNNTTLDKPPDSEKIFTDFNSDDDLADPDYIVSDDENEPTPIASSSIQHIEAPSSVDTNISLQEETNSLIVRRNKRKRPEKWKKNARKIKRNCGEEYISAKGKKRTARSCGTENCKCLRVCHIKVDTDTRQKLFDSFWGLGNIDRQRDYIATNVFSIEVSGSRVANSRRKFTLSYGFKVDGERITVCQPFYLNTLGISEKMVRTALKKARRGMGYIQSPDKRGRHVPVNKYDIERFTFANDHIDLFPAVPSHWCRKDTKKVYLESTLNKEKMFDLYKQHCLVNNQDPICKTSYKELILKKNIDFHKPRKDQCWCHKYEQLSEEDQKEKQEDYEEHINRKEYVKEEKKTDKIKAMDDSTMRVCTFDFEAVLYCPLVLGKPVFYKRKLGSMNFTINNSVTKQGYCYFWPEYEGNRGANEVSTCLHHYITTLTDVEHLVLYSDCCPGQNRNSVVATMLHSVLASPDNNIKVIDYKFLEPGHTYMECDNMHSTIERASEYAKIYTPDDWQNVLRLARKDNPYDVHVMNHTDFLDFKAMRANVFPRTLKATDGNIMQWTKIRWLRLRKEVPDLLFFKFDYWEDFKEVKLKGRVTRSGYSHPVTTQLYFGQILLKEIKHKDLMAMCRDGTIPKNYHNYYQNLPVSGNSSSSSAIANIDVDNNDELTLSATRSSYLRRRPRRIN